MLMKYTSPLIPWTIYRSVFVCWDLFGSRDLTITSWAGLGFYGMDFGRDLGSWSFVGIPYTEADGVGLVLPRRSDKGG